MQSQFSFIKKLYFFLILFIIPATGYSQSDGTFNIFIEDLIQVSRPKAKVLKLSGLLNCRENFECEASGLNGSKIEIHQSLNTKFGQRQSGMKNVDGSSTGSFIIGDYVYSFKARVSGSTPCLKRSCEYDIKIVSQPYKYGSLVLDLKPIIRFNRRNQLIVESVSGEGQVSFYSANSNYLSQSCPTNFSDQETGNGEWTNYGPYNVEAGTSLNAILRPDLDHPEHALLYIKNGQNPSSEDWDCRPYDSSATKSNELCSIAGPGNFYIGIHSPKGENVGFDLDISGCTDPSCPYQQGCPTNECPFVRSHTNIDFNQWHDYGPFVVKEGQELQVNLESLNGDANLYVKKDSWPNSTDWECRSANPNLEGDICVLKEPGTYYVSVLGYLGKIITYHLNVGGCSNSYDIDQTTNNPDELEIGVFLFDCLNDPNKQDATEIASYMFDKSLEPTSPYRNSISNFFEKASDGRVNMIGDIFGWYTNFCEPQTCFKTYESALEHVIQQEPDLDLSAYDGFLFYYNVDRFLCPANGSANFGKKELQTSQGTTNAYVANVYAKGGLNKFRTNSNYSNTSNDVVAHEYTHAIAKAQHPAGLDCGNIPLSQSPEASCDLKGSYDQFSIMSNFRVANLQNTEIDSALKERLGWLSPNQIQTVTTDGEYTIHNYDKPEPDQIISLKIPLKKPILIPDGSGFVANFLYIEYRGFTDLGWRPDSLLDIIQKDLSYYTIPDNHGALVRAIDCQTKDYCWSFLLDMRRLLFDPYRSQSEFADAPLILGEEFLEPLNNILIKVIEVDKENKITVSIDYLDN